MSLVQIAVPSKAKGPKYWRSLDQVADTPEFRQWVEREFPSTAVELLDGKTRRGILKVMAASFGMAGLVACSRPELRFAPQVRGQMDYVPGAPYNYTTAMVLNGQATGLVVETYDGRPHKIEGNPDHPVSQGAATAMMQASVLDIYDPDRSKQVLNGKTASTWEAFEAALRGLPLATGGLRILSETVVSPTLDSLRAQLLAKYPNAAWVEYDAISRENERAGTMLAFGQALNVHPQYDQARVVLSLDHDFLGIDTASPLATKLFSKRRRMEAEEDLERLSRLYVIESQFSLTGANAEHRLRARGSDVRQFAQDLLAGLSAAPATSTDRRAKFLSAVVADLKSAGAEALVVAGPRQPAGVHALAHQINQALGSKAVTFTAASRPERVTAGVEALAALAGEMNNGAVTTLLVIGANPVYTAPADVQFGAALAKVANSIHLGQSVDETAAAAKWHLPEAHYLETWGDARTTAGVASIQQPMIEPIYGGKSAIEFLAHVLDLPEKNGHQIVKAYWSAQLPAANRENVWRKALNDGVVSVAAPAVSPKTNDAQIAAALGTAAPAAAGIEVAFVPGAATWDGRFANNAWMQETPDPMTKLVWGNAVMISPAMARAQKLENGDMVTLSQGNTRLDAAVMIQPGQADGSVTLSLGYGRTRAGSVGDNVGFNANLIRTADAFWYKPGFTMTTTGAAFGLVTTQEHGTMEEPKFLGSGETRPVFREATIEEYKKEPKIIEEMVEVPALISVHPPVADYTTGYQWGMAIDLGACTGCSACVVACQAENNTPVVGKDMVARGREMHWLRIDRYYVGDEDEPRAVEQPIPCMQCENAPCEYVCPVAATTHSPEGLNDMAYNRCVGTRYCSNNCPYKVRHFNFLNYHKDKPDILAMVHNPEVTVRMRGIMEKCTYCVQRIESARIAAKVDGRREIREGDVITACQQTCPADAIAFGNINDPNSRVSKLKKQERNYGLLAELQVRPRTTYLGRLRNVNPTLEPAGQEKDA